MGTLTRQPQYRLDFSFHRNEILVNLLYRVSAVEPSQKLPSHLPYQGDVVFVRRFARPKTHSTLLTGSAVRTHSVAALELQFLTMSRSVCGHSGVSVCDQRQEPAYNQGMGISLGPAERTRLWPLDWESRQLRARMGLSTYSGKSPEIPKLSVLADLYVLCK